MSVNLACLSFRAFRAVQVAWRYNFNVLTGTTISHYKILDKLGEGGMGVVYKAKDLRLKREVALKFLPSHLLGDGDIRARFEREAQAAAALHHPNICPVHEIDAVDDKSFISMAFIEGEPLDKKIAQGPLRIEEALDIAQQVAKGLEAAHKRAIVHRDIKPENIIVDDMGHVTIMDFGLAQLTEASRLTKTDQTMGTVFYMSPEQTEGSGTDHRADIWSLGVVLYEMVTGQRPFKGDYDKAVMYSILHEGHQPITAIRAGIPMELEVFVGKCLQKEAANRYASAGELAVDLATLADGLKSDHSKVLRPGSVANAAEPRSPRAPWLIVAAASVLAVVLVVGVAWLRWPEAAPEPALRRFAFETNGPVQDVVISPNGRYIAYIRLPIRGSGGLGELWVQDLELGEARRIGESEFLRDPFWSPDSQFIGVGTPEDENRDGTTVMKVPVSGGVAVALSDDTARFRGGSWSPDGETVFLIAGRPTALYEACAYRLFHRYEKG